MFRKIALLVPAVTASKPDRDCAKQLSGAYDCPVNELVDMYAKLSTPNVQTESSAHCIAAKDCMSAAITTERLTLAKTKLAMLSAKGKIESLQLKKEQHLSSNTDEETQLLDKQLFQATEAYCAVIRDSVFVKNSIRGLTANEAKECSGLAELLEEQKAAVTASADEKAKVDRIHAVDTLLDTVFQRHLKGVLAAKSVADAAEDKSDALQVLNSVVSEMCGEIKSLEIESYEGSARLPLIQQWCPELLVKEAPSKCQSADLVQATIADLVATNSGNYSALLQLDETCSDVIDIALSQAQAGEMTPEVAQVIAAIANAVTQNRLAVTAAECDALVASAAEQKSIEELEKIQQVANATQCDSGVMRKLTETIQRFVGSKDKCQQLMSEREGLSGDELKAKILEAQQAGCEVIASNNRETNSAFGLSPGYAIGGTLALGSIGTAYLYKDKIMDSINSFRGKGAAASVKGAADQAKPSKGLSKGAIAGIIFGLLVLLALGTWMVYRYRQSRN